MIVIEKYPKFPGVFVTLPNGRRFRIYIAPEEIDAYKKILPNKALRQIKALINVEVDKPVRIVLQ